MYDFIQGCLTTWQVVDGVKPGLDVRVLALPPCKHKDSLQMPFHESQTHTLIT